MKRTQNEKILQIKNETLIVGVDIAKKIHHARAFDNRGVELGKLLKFENSAQGFAAFDAWLAKIQQKHGMTEAVVGFEPTGHYWFNLGVAEQTGISNTKPCFGWKTANLKNGQEEFGACAPSSAPTVAWQ